MHLALALLAMLAVVAPALAGTIPLRYDHPHPDMILVEKSAVEVDRICKAIGGKLTKANGHFGGCAPIGVKKCAVVVVRNHPLRAEIIRHERAHCNGWGAHHPR